ncbi:YpoC family protein [Bacillus sp. CGMCC 1.16541]|uniref:YpoC family protein n=1 Tax=Bacillus sp. CGMCC 1.16541 TaxID=2185143 RepID=UPI000D7311C0|nr:hypothetical protein [Bacillus sp. CGMCC 1.16541]
MTKQTKVPPQFYHPLFFSKASVMERCEKKVFKEVMLSSFFPYDLRLQPEEPWKQPQDFVPYVFELWNELETKIALLHKKRQAHATQMSMKYGVANFISALFWMNGVKVSRLTHLDEDVKELTYKPINIGERIAFIMTKPHLYHSFIQLSELYQELQKLYAKLVIIHKK